jgi:hypothetical protein
MAAAETALQPAWAALDVGEHKVPPTPPQPQRSRAANLARGPSPARASPARAERPHRGTPGSGATAGAASSAPQEGLAAACSSQSAPGMAQSGIAVSPFSAAQSSAAAACACAPDAGGWSPSPESQRCGGSAGAAAADAERCSGGFRTPPRTRSRSIAERAGAGQAGQEAALAASPAGSQRGSQLFSAAGAVGCGRAGSPGAAAAGGEAEPARAGTAGDWPAAPFLRRFSAAWVHVSMATAGVALRERQRRYADAADLLRLLLGAAPARRGCTRLPRCARVQAVPWCVGSVQSQMHLIHEQGSGLQA